MQMIQRQDKSEILSKDTKQLLKAQNAKVLIEESYKHLHESNKRVKK